LSTTAFPGMRTSKTIYLIRDRYARARDIGNFL
jgi:hypothetical protein